jgi:tetratricopeptide (TPR) repeat protein
LYNRAATRVAVVGRPEAPANEQEELLDGAREDCDRALALDPKFRHPYGLRARILWRQARRDGPSATGLEDALKAFEEAVKRLPDDPVLWEGYAMACADLGEARGSAEEFRRSYDVASEAIRRFPTRARGYDTRAYARWRLYQIDGEREKDVRAAEQDYARYTMLEPDEPSGWLNLGKVRFFLKDYKGAMEAIDRAGTLEPSAEVEQWRARVQAELDKTEY